MSKTEKKTKQQREKKAVPPPTAKDLRRWVIIDVENKVLGRTASTISCILRGKHRPDFVPHQDKGDFVIVVNADKIRLTGKKLTNKIYYHHTGYPGGLKAASAGELLRKHPARLLEKAVAGMLPKNSLSRHLMTKLFIYTGKDHPHAAQQPQALDLLRNP